MTYTCAQCQEEVGPLVVYSLERAYYGWTNPKRPGELMSRYAHRYCSKACYDAHGVVLALKVS